MARAEAIVTVPVRPSLLPPRNMLAQADMQRPATTVRSPFSRIACTMRMWQDAMQRYAGKVDTIVFHDSPGGHDTEDGLGRILEEVGGAADH